MSSIFGIGIDVVDISRFHETLERTPGFSARVFTVREISLPLASLAARFAAKEALAKALNAKEPFNWQEVEIINEETGKPTMAFLGAMKNRMAEYIVHVTLSHDAGIASAMVIVERGQ